MSPSKPGKKVGCLNGHLYHNTNHTRMQEALLLLLLLLHVGNCIHKNARTFRFLRIAVQILRETHRSFHAESDLSRKEKQDPACNRKIQSPSRAQVSKLGLGHEAELGLGHEAELCLGHEAVESDLSSNIKEDPDGARAEGKKVPAVLGLGLDLSSKVWSAKFMHALARKLS